MLVIGERMNQRIKKVGEAIENRDEGYLQELAKKQVENGAKCLDVYVEDAKEMKWVIEKIKEVIDVPLCIDTTEIDILKVALPICDKAIVNSINLGQRLEPFLNLIVEYEVECVALAMDEEKGIPRVAEDRVEICRKILDAASNAGIDKEKIYFDSLVLPVAVGSENGLITLQTLELLKKEGMKTTIGLTNISYGLPNRGLIEGAFLISALRYLDAVMLNPEDKEVMSMLKAGEAVMGVDKHCRSYLRDYR
jgi:5-methyltetrahydrofolate--homocysteine methyltransferase